MTDVNSRRATSRSWFCRALLVLALAAGVASSATVPARADDDHRGDRHDDRRDDRHDDRGRWDRGDRRDYHPYGGYAPGYVYAPPPVYYAPPPPSPGINLVFPLRIR